MRISAGTIFLTSVLSIWGASLGACDCACDSVAPGFYGPMAGSAGASAPGTGSRPPATSSAAGSSSSPGTPTGPTHVAGSGADAPPPAGSKSDAGTSSGTPPTVPPSAGPAAAGCDMTGRWLFTQHLVADALGSLQYGHYVHYYEIEQHGDAFVVKKGMLCGFDSIGSGAFAATAEFKASWPGTIKNLSFAGQTGTSAASSGGCMFDMPKYYATRCATVSYYRDPANPLPTAQQQATGSTPGWEDWDGDGNPGCTGNITGPITGKVFVAPRIWTAVSATVPNVAASFRVPVQWNQEQNVMSYDGTPLLGTESVRGADNTLHFAEFARLTDDQATGDDPAICKAIMELAPTLTPVAAGL